MYGHICNMTINILRKNLKLLLMAKPIALELIMFTVIRWNIHDHHRRMGEVFIVIRWNT